MKYYPINAKCIIQQSKIKYCAKNLKDTLYKSKKMININNQLHPTVALDMAFLKPLGEANPYVWFLYIPQKKFNNIQGQVLLSMNSDLINSNKLVKNQKR